MAFGKQPETRTAFIGKGRSVIVQSKPRTGKAPRVETHTLHTRALNAIAISPEVRSSNVAEQEAGNHAAPYSNFMRTYLAWQLTRPTKDGFQTDPVAEFAGALLLARHVFRSSVLIDSDPRHKVPMVQAGTGWFQPCEQMARHANALASHIDRECNEPSLPSMTDGPTVSTICQTTRHISFIIKMLARNCQDANAGEVLKRAMERYDGSFVMEAVRSDVAEPTTLGATMRTLTKRQCG